MCRWLQGRLAARTRSGERGCGQGRSRREHEDSPAAGSRRNQEHTASAAWWLVLLAGVAWVLLSLAILQFDVRSIRSIAILFGVVLIVAAADETFAALGTRGTCPGPSRRPRATGTHHGHRARRQPGEPQP
jgi:hypothetical protein